MNAYGNLAEAHVDVGIFVSETVELADSLSNLSAADVDITLGKGGLQINGSTVVLIPLHITVGIDQTHLNLISCQCVVAIVGLRPCEVHLVFW